MLMTPPWSAIAYPVCCLLQTKEAGPFSTPPDRSGGWLAVRLRGSNVLVGCRGVGGVGGVGGGGCCAPTPPCSSGDHRGASSKSDSASWSSPYCSAVGAQRVVGRGGAWVSGFEQAAPLELSPAKRDHLASVMQLSSFCCLVWLLPLLPGGPSFFGAKLPGPHECRHCPATRPCVQASESLSPWRGGFGAPSPNAADHRM